MICIIALIVFGILGIFSAKYRKIAKESFDCVFRRVTFRPCRSNLDKRLKSEITGKVMRRSPRAGRFVYKYFEVFSWIVLAFMLASLFFSARGVYYYAKYGNCNGPDSSQFCIFNPFGNQGANPTPDDLKAPDLAGEFGVGPSDAPITIVEFGCFTCPYTKAAEPGLQELLFKYKDKMRYYYLYYPIQAHSHSMDAAIAAECAKQQGRFMEFRQRLFELNPYITGDDIKVCCEDLGMNLSQFNDCLNSTSARAAVDRNIGKGKASGIYGTPTFFVNGKAFVGPESIKDMDGFIAETLENT